MAPSEERGAVSFQSAKRARTVSSSLVSNRSRRYIASNSPSTSSVFSATITCCVSSFVRIRDSPPWCRGPERHHVAGPDFLLSAEATAYPTKKQCLQPRRDRKAPRSDGSCAFACPSLCASKRVRRRLLRLLPWPNWRRPNAIELDPVLAFTCLTASTPRGTPAPGKVRLVSLTSPVAAGSNATLTVAVPTATNCSIVVTYKSGPSSAVGLYAQRASGGR